MTITEGYTAPNSEVWLRPQEWKSAYHSEIELGKMCLSAELWNAASEFERRIDPDGTLPVVELTPDIEHVNLTSAWWQKYRIFTEYGDDIGYCCLSFDGAGPHAYFAEVAIGEDLQSRDVDMTFRGKGFGTSTYLTVISQAIQQGYGFQSYEAGLSKDGYKMWNRLLHYGVAKVSEYGKISPNNGMRFRYATTRFRVLSPAELAETERPEETGN